MGKISLLLCFMLFACSAKKQGVVTSAALLESCPKDGNCKIELLLNKGLSLKADDYGKTYYELSESAATNVIKYQYSRIVKGNLQDAGYREEVVFEIAQNMDALTLSDKKLEQSKMLYGRFCFCKGQTGYYKVENGTLNISGAKTEKTGTLDFQIPEVPQIVKHIDFVLK